MADRTLNYEIDILNIGNVDNDIRDFFARAMISEKVNTANTATQIYEKGIFFIHNDRKLYKAIEYIEIGDVITPDVNVKKYSVSDALEEIFSGGTGGGHTIQNESGTNVTQRSTLQFTGDVEVTDDAGNQKTIVNIPKATEITWEEWQALTDEEKETGKWDITDVPNVDGTINSVEEAIQTTLKYEDSYTAPRVVRDGEPTTIGTYVVPANTNNLTGIGEVTEAGIYSLSINLSNYTSNRYKFGILLEIMEKEENAYIFQKRYEFEGSNFVQRLGDTIRLREGQKMIFKGVNSGTSVSSVGNASVVIYKIPTKPVE